MNHLSPNQVLQNIIELNGYLQIPDEVIDRAGLRVKTNTVEWILNAASYSHDTINLEVYQHPFLHYAVSIHLIHYIKKLSPTECINIQNDISAHLSRIGFLDGLSFDWELDEYEEALSRAILDILAMLRSENKLDRFYRICRWYLWCAEHIPECGFNQEIALQLSRVTIPGNVKGEAVRSKDPNTGPLDFELEEPLLRKYLLEDESEVFEHMQQRVAVALCLAFGRNPMNYAQLREEDMKNLTADYPKAKDLWQLHIPRIKKRSKPREFFRAETCDKRLADMILELINKNQQFQTMINDVEMPRALFLRTSHHKKFIGTDNQEWCFHFKSNEFSKLLSQWAKRVNLKHPVTHKIIHLTARRLRYTFACNMARQGVNRATLAEMLDHTDTQHVGVYYDLSEEIVGMLDKALASQVGKVLGWFKGTIIDDDSDAVNGDNPDKHLFFIGENEPEDQTEIGVCGESKLCHLDPPYSCYLCPKFQPYRHADHDHVLELLLKDRDARLKQYKNARLGIQLDDVIFAVGQVVSSCQEVVNG